MKNIVHLKVMDFLEIILLSSFIYHSDIILLSCVVIMLIEFFNIKENYEIKTNF